MHRQGMDEFQEWLKKQIANENDAISFPKIELKSDQSMGYGLFTTEDIRQNEILIKIPAKFMITPQFVADIPEYANILKTFRLDPVEILALFFAFERIYFVYYYKQNVEEDQAEDEINNGMIYNLKGIKQFMKSRNETILLALEEGATTDEILWWKAYIGVLPHSFGTPIFKHYLEENSETTIHRIAAQLPIQIKEKLVAQLAELKRFETKLFNIVGLFEENLEEYKITSDNYNIKKSDEDEETFWKQIACWAWHVVNTRCIFVDDLAFHPLVDSIEVELEKKKKSGTNSRIHQNRRFSVKKGKTEPTDYGGSLALVPLVDMLNHKPDCIPMFDKKLNSYIVRAEQHVMAGEQLFVCYGAHDNARLWIEYGFRMEENPFNRVNIPIELFIALAEKCGTPVSSTKREILAKADLPCTIYATDDFPSYALRKNCSILLLPREKLSNWSQYIWDWGDEDEFMEGGGKRLLQSISKRLQFALIARRKEATADEEIQPFWDDLIQILQKIIENLDTN